MCNINSPAPYCSLRRHITICFAHLLCVPSSFFILISILLAVLTRSPHGESFSFTCSSSILPDCLFPELHKDGLSDVRPGHVQVETAVFSAANSLFFLYFTGDNHIFVFCFVFCLLTWMELVYEGAGLQGRVTACRTVTRLFPVIPGGTSFTSLREEKKKKEEKRSSIAGILATSATTELACKAEHQTLQWERHHWLYKKKKIIICGCEIKLSQLWVDSGTLQSKVLFNTDSSFSSQVSLMRCSPHVLQLGSSVRATELYWQKRPSSFWKEQKEVSSPRLGCKDWKKVSGVIGSNSWKPSIPAHLFFRMKHVRTFRASRVMFVCNVAATWNIKGRKESVYIWIVLGCQLIFSILQTLSAHPIPCNINV